VSSAYNADQKIRPTFLLPKEPYFKSLQPEKTSPALLKHLQTNSSTQNIYKRFQKPEIKPS